MKKFSFIICTLVTAAVAVSCGSSGKQGPEKAKINALVLKDTISLIEYKYPAIIKGVQDVDIYPQVSGRITEIKIVQGQYVKKDQILFVIDDIPYKAAYDSAVANEELAKAEVASAQLTADSKKNLYEQGIISKVQYTLAVNELNVAKAKLSAARAALEKASNDLSYTRVRTMGDGYVGELPYFVGSLVGTNITEPLTRVSDNSSVYADFSVPENIYLELADRKEADIDKLKANRVPLALITNDGQRYEHTGSIHSISGLISKTTGALPVRAIFPNPDKKVLSGSSAQVVFGFQHNVVRIPRTAMKELQDKLFVFRIKNNTLEQVPVNAMRLSASYWALMPDADGKFPLAAGDSIAASTNRLIDGQSVEILK